MTLLFVKHHHTEQNFQPLLGPHINQLIAKETATSKGVEVCTSKSRVVVSISLFSEENI